MRPWALVTGASSGIGRELAGLAAADGHSLVLVARSWGPLEALGRDLALRHGTEVLLLPMDLCGRDAADVLARELELRSIVPTLLINSAGLGAYGLHRDLALDAEQALLEVNVVSLTRLTKLLLPAMLARRAGRILNVASTAAFLPGPYMAVYYASKAYVLHYSEALAQELKGSGVTVTALCPGPTPTRFQARAGMPAARLRRLSLATTGVEQVARAGYRALLRGRPVVVPGVLNALLVQSLRWLPRRLVTAAAGRLARPR